MKTFNHFSVSGRLGQDATIVNAGNNKKATFSIALNTAHKNAAGETTSTATAWMNLSAIRKPEKAAEFEALKKGAYLTINGTFEANEFDTKDGKHVKEIVFKAISWEPVAADDNQEEKKEA